MSPNKSRSVWWMGPLTAALASLAAVMFFVGVLGLVFLPREIGRLLNDQYVSVTHCLDLGAGRPLIAVYWQMGRSGMLGWQHRIAVQSGNAAAPSAALAFSDRKPLSLAKGPAADQAIVGNWDGTIYSLDVRDETAEPHFVGQNDDGAVVALASSDDGEWVLSQGAFRLHAWNIQSQSERWRRDDVAPYCFVIRPDASAAIIATSTGDLLEVDLASGRTQRTLESAQGPLLTISLSSDGDKLAVLRCDGEIVLLDSLSGEPLWNLQPRRCQTAAGRIAAFSPCGSMLVTVSRDDGKTLAVWSVATGEEIRQLDGHRNIVIGAAFTEAGLLRSWGADGTIRAWDLTSGRTIHVATLAPLTDAS